MTRKKTEQRGLRTAHESKADRLERSQSSAPSPQSFDMYIEELVLHGFAAGDRHRIGEAIEQYVRKSFTGGPPPTLFRDQHHIDRIDGGTFHVTRGRTMESVAEQTAQTVLRALRKE